MKKSISKRVKITKTGKIRRRPPGLCHSRANKNRKQVLRKRGERIMDLSSRVLNKGFLLSLIGSYIRPLAQ